MGGGKTHDFIVGEPGGFDGGHDLGLGDVFLAFGIDDPDGSARDEVFLESGYALELCGGFDAEEDEIRIFGGACLGGVGDLGEDLAEEFGILNPEERDAGFRTDS